MLGVAAGSAVLEPLARGADALAAAAPEGNPRESRPLGRTGFTVATVGIGAMLTRDPDVIRHAVDNGVNYVDTADCYMGGENERIVGRALEGIRRNVVLATKVHIAPVADMIRSVENSLQSLRTDVIDIMQLHGIGTEDEVTNGNAREALRKLIDQGKIRVPGVTTHSGQETVLRAVVRHGFYQTVLVAYNFRSGDALTAAIRDAGAAGIGVIGMKTQAGGYPVPGAGASSHQAALAWVLGNRAVATTIPSMVSFAQVDENLKARGMRLAWSGRKSLERYGRAIGDRHCGLCGGCDGICPNGVDVPAVLRSLTYLEGYREPLLARGSYRGLGRNADASACAACARCVVTCRLGLDVARLARAAHEQLA